MKAFMIAAILLVSGSSYALNFHCEFNSSTIRSSQIVTNRGLDQKVRSGYVDIQMKNKTDYTVSVSVVPESASFSMGPTLVPDNSILNYDAVNQKLGNRLMGFAIKRQNVHIGTLNFSISSDQKRVSINWNQSGDESRIGYYLRAQVNCLARHP